MSGATGVTGVEAAQRLAAAVAAAMWASDEAVRGLGIVLVDIRPGGASMRMKLRADMVNSHQIAHGGFIFTLADAAFAYACNSYNHRTVAAACHIDFLAAAHAGEELLAHAVERSRSGRTGVYDVTVTTGEGKSVALLRGRSHQLGGAVVALDVALDATLDVARDAAIETRETP